ncbi:hypothetical protein GY21_01560 [Cryobacterium roopkundense]|uniref:Peptide O-xylosyltransferase n=1 Tax=Cryobacterium roopkundense TaxID=1001240 RepID=A0A099JVT2_9MICO|nr:beta-1,6-N-acetylglucosaminyltransferase [Cryobacterium roopkundense]KGJ81787.1 hypothetical protein GY21_01560 [Cryobacterium roopkundense]MBB5642399.1 hypothetical protein [Cryobacterium roopkundense]
MPAPAIAFLVLAHADPEQVKRLVARLKPHDVFIHVDAKTTLDAAWAQVDAQLIPNRVPVYWAGFSQVHATLALLKAALATNTVYDRIVLLSGACYPSRPLPELEDLFRTNPGRNFIKYVHVRESAHLSTLIDHVYFRGGILPWRATTRSRALLLAERVLRKCLEKASSLVTRKPLAGWTPFHGSAYWAITPEAGQHILDTVAGSRGQALEKYYRRAFASDEQFFHTIIGNSSFAECSTGPQEFLGRGTYRMGNLHLVDPSLTKWFGPGDLQMVTQSPMYFVRKVRSSTSAGLLDALDQRAGEVTKAPQ